MVKKYFSVFGFLMVFDLALVAGFVWLSENGARVGLGNFSEAPPLWAILVFVTLLTAPMLIGMWVLASVPGWIAQVRQTGQTGVAEILANDYMNGVSRYRGSDGAMDVPVRVLPDLDAPFESKLTCRLSEGLALKAGMRVAIKYDPANHKRVVLAQGGAENLFTSRVYIDTARPISGPPAIQINAGANQIMYNGQTYDRVEDMPAEARAQYQHAMALMGGDANQNGQPDLLESGQLMAYFKNLADGAGLSATASDPCQKLQALKRMLDAGLITAAEYEAKKAELLKQM
jgi:hypothetical protein